MKWLHWLKTIPRDALALILALRDPGVSLPAKAIIAGCIFYVILPVDLIPDFIPVVGFLDDLAAMPVAGYFARKYINPDTLGHLRWRADMLLRRVKPKVLIAIVVLVFGWLLLAAYAGWRALPTGGSSRQQPLGPGQIAVPAEFYQRNANAPEQ